MSETTAVDGVDFKKLFSKSEVDLPHPGKKGPSGDTSIEPETQSETTETCSRIGGELSMRLRDSTFLEDSAWSVLHLEGNLEDFSCF